MNMIKFLPHAGIIAVLAAVMQFMDIKIAWFSAWVGFAAWACYFLNGCTVKGGLKVIGCWVGGVVASILIIELGTRFSAGMGASVGFPLAVGMVAFCVILVSCVGGQFFGWVTVFLRTAYGKAVGLENGESPKAFEITPDKKVVWKMPAATSPYNMGSMQILDIPGNPHKFEIFR